DFDSFLLQINNAVQKTFYQTFREKAQSFFSLDESQVEALIANIKENLDEGSFKFVVLMDAIHDQLKDLILYMNQNSKFDIYGVELEYYKHEGFEIIIPKLFGSEVKKDIPTKRSNTTFISDEEFISLYKTIGLDKKIQELLDLQKSIQNGEIKYEGWNADRMPKTINFFYRIPAGTRMSLVLSIGYYRETPYQTLDFWLYDKDIEKRVLSAIRNSFSIESNFLKPDVKFGIVARWPIKEFTKDKLLAFFSSVSKGNKI
ncbi:hypothetical protein HZB69_04260, partial [Candidatus Amesbacteria bacterium]|nr:hypothetical protein [Candidatus Amesbacteria bacterium]